MVHNKIGNLSLDLDIMQIIIHKINLNKSLELFLGELTAITEIIITRNKFVIKLYIQYGWKKSSTKLK